MLNRALYDFFFTVKKVHNTVEIFQKIMIFYGAPILYHIF